MPTILDSLVVELALDPTRFNEGEREAIRSLAKMRESAERGVDALGTTTKRGLKDYLASFDEQLKTVQLALVNLGAQSRRSGETVRSGAMAGAEGFSALATAGLAAYAALKTVQETLGKIGQTVGGAVQTGRSAFFTGLPVQWLSAFGQYAFATGNVPQAQTEALLNQFQQQRETYKLTGQYPAEFSTLSRFFGMGEADLANLPMPELLQRISAGLQSRRGPEIQNLLSRLNLGQLAPTLARGPEALQRGVAEHLPTAVTPGQYEAFQKLQEAINNVETAWDGLVRRVIEANPQWLTIVTTWRDWLVQLQSTPEGLRAVEAAATAVSIVIGFTIVAAVEKFVLAVIAANARMLATPLGRLLLIGYGAYEGAKELYQHPLQHLIPETPEQYRKRIEGYKQEQGIDDAKSGWTWWKPWTWGNTVKDTQAVPAPQSGIFPAGRLSVAQMRDLALQTGFSPQDAPTIAAIAMAESGGNPNARGAAGEYGITQILPGSTGAHVQAAEAYGNPLRAMQLAHEIFQSEGWRAWSVYKSGAYQSYMGAAAQAAPAAAALVTPAAGTYAAALGDSIAVGLAAAGAGGGSYRDDPAFRRDLAIDAVSGRTPAEVLAQIQGSDLSRWRGRNVLLSSGASNDPSQIGLVAQQIAALRTAGANPTLLGVGEGVQGYGQVNKQLAAIAAGAGANFSLGRPTSTGALEGTEGGRVHPGSYGTDLRDLNNNLAVIRSGTGAPHRSVTNDNSVDNDVNATIYMTPPNTADPRAWGHAAAAQLKSSLTVTSANTGLE